jgi:hypothetical protein
MLAAQDSGNYARKPTYDKAVGIDQDPLLLDVLGLEIEGLHGSRAFGGNSHHLALARARLV